MEIKRILYVFAAGVLLTACQKVETPMFSDKDAFVAFTNKSYKTMEGADDIFKVPVKVVSVNGLDVTVDFEVSAEAYSPDTIKAVEGVDYEILNESRQLTFSKEKMTDSIYIKVNNIDALYKSPRHFDIKLKNNKGCNMGAYYTAAITVQDDDHPYRDLFGTYTVTATDPSDETGTKSIQWEVEVSPDDDPAYLTRMWIYPILSSSYVSQPVKASINLNTARVNIPMGQVLGSYSVENDILLAGFYSQDQETYEITFDLAGVITCNLTGVDTEGKQVPGADIAIRCSSYVMMARFSEDDLENMAPTMKGSLVYYVYGFEMKKNKE